MPNSVNERKKQKQKRLAGCTNVQQRKLEIKVVLSYQFVALCVWGVRLGWECSCVSGRVETLTPTVVAAKAGSYHHGRVNRNFHSRGSQRDVVYNG